jgi:uncharacterized damage-inducible protein DinB
MSLRHTLAHRLKDTWHGSPWYGDPSDKVIGGITATEASKRIAPGTHTIWEITLHMVAWTETVAARVRGLGSKAPDRGDWPAMPAASADAWAASLAELASAREQLLGDVHAAHEEDFHLHVKQHDSPFGDTGISRAGTVAGLIEHDTYHLGQIALLKRAVRAN